jgi:hypothetical protein
MRSDRINDPDLEPLAPEDVDSAPTPADEGDPSDEVPVPIAMSPAEIDERAQVVERLRREPPQDDSTAELGER